ncbi:MAG: diaminopimelate decarboxylase [Vicinamibacteria bacterium]|jgi:diaminopimelate decarboxylase|nr:diaminopimelate decarboxylase [Vicinamibacteria bacterium]
MDLFHVKQGRMYCEGVALSDLGQRFGTPTYIYSLGTVLLHYRRFEAAFAGIDHQIFYSVKANSNMAIMAALAQEGCGFDVFSGGELYRVRRAGGEMRKTVFAGVGKTERELELAIRAGIQMFNMESWQEAEALNAIARKLGRKVQADFRINPDVDAHTHAKITTGKRESKFGIPIADAPAIYARARRLSHIDLIGVHLHIGSQITEVSPYIKSIRKTIGLVKALREQGQAIRTFNLGGGMGIVYDQEKPHSALQFANAIMPLISGHGLKLLIEPGRFIVGNAGVLLTRVLYVKPTARKTFVIIDAGMNDLVRPTLYGSYHAILPISQAAERRAKQKVDVVGPICESGDFLAKDRRLPLPRAGELLAVRSAGAYGYVMSSNYHSRPRAAEVLVDGGRAFEVNKRETYEDLVSGETIPKHLRRRARG